MIYAHYSAAGLGEGMLWVRTSGVRFWGAMCVCVVYAQLRVAHVMHFINTSTGKGSEASCELWARFKRDIRIQPGTPLTKEFYYFTHRGQHIAASEIIPIGQLASESRRSGSTYNWALKKRASSDDISDVPLSSVPKRRS